MIEVGDWVVGGRHANDIDIGQIVALDDNGIGAQVAWVGGADRTWCPVCGQNDFTVYATREEAEVEAARRHRV